MGGKAAAGLSDDEGQVLKLQPRGEAEDSIWVLHPPRLAFQAAWNIHPIQKGGGCKELTYDDGFVAAEESGGD